MSFDVEVPKTFEEVSNFGFALLMKNENYVSESFDKGFTFSVEWLGKIRIVGIIKCFKYYVDPDYFKPLSKEYES